MQNSCDTTRVSRAPLSDSLSGFFEGRSGVDISVSMFRVFREVVSMFAKSEFSDTFPVWDLSELGEQGTVFSVGGGVGIQV
jgi:hypothetical protein